MERVKKAIEGSDVDEIKQACEALNTSSHKLAEAMYAQASGAGQAGAEQAAGGEEAGQAHPGAAADDDVVDADFAGFREGEGYQLGRIAELYQIKGEYAEAIKTYQEALKIHQEMGHLHGAATGTQFR